MRTKEKREEFKNKRTDAQKELDRLFITEYLVKAYTITQIYKKLNDKNKELYQISYQQVYQDSKKIMQEWHDERMDLIDHETDKILKTLEKMQQEAWEAWEKSKELAKLKTKSEGKLGKSGELEHGKIVEQTKETGYGDTKYLDVVQYCIDKRMELFGLKKIRIDQINRNLNKNVDEIDWDNIDEKKKKVLREIYGLTDEFERNNSKK